MAIGKYPWGCRQNCDMACQCPSVSDEAYDNPAEGCEQYQRLIRYWGSPENAMDEFLKMLMVEKYGREPVSAYD